MKRYKIIALDERDDEGQRLCWSNEDGWTVGWEGDLFTLSEVWNLDLPEGGAWVPVET